MKRRDEDASATTEMVLVTPVLLVMLAFVVFAGRLGGVQQQVLTAAGEAARAASMQTTEEAGRTAAQESAKANLADVGVVCADLTVGVGTGDFRRGGTVSVTVTCVVGLDDLAFAGMPGSREYQATAVEVIDLFRGGG